jgi:uncharacterized protein
MARTQNMKIEETGILQTAVQAVALPAMVCAFGLALFWSLPANAQSFSCAKAENPAEFAICNDEGLLSLDEKLGNVFADAYVKASTTPQRQAVARDHNNWLKVRNSCRGDFTCLTLRYNERISALSSNS